MDKGGERRGKKTKERNGKRRMDKEQRQNQRKKKEKKERKESEVNVRDCAAVLSGKFKHLEHPFESLAEDKWGGLAT